jgi:hypothetical protein
MSRQEVFAWKVSTHRLPASESQKYNRNNTGKFILPENGKIFFNTFNNMWATGCPQWISGSYHLEFYILSD